MPLRLPASLLAFALLAGCVATSPRPPEVVSAPATTAPQAAPATVAANDNLNAVAWTQTAIEHDLIYLQTYRDAQAELLAALRDRSWDALARDDRAAPLRGLKPAVVLDIDETVLDNSPYQARLVKSGGEYNEAEGLSPDGKWVLVESSHDQGSADRQTFRYIDIWKLALDPSAAFARMTRFSDYEGRKAANPVVSPDGSAFAFQAGRASDPPGVGYGIFVMRLK